MARSARVKRRPVRSLGRSAIDTVVFLVALAMVVALLKFSGVLTIDDGPVKVIDGDSLRRDNTEIRLAGIDAPEYRQTCKDEAGEDWPCGRVAAQELRKLVGGRDVGCTVLDTDRYGRLVAQCMSGSLNLNLEMVQRGFAVSFGDYVEAEAEARAAKRGIWRGTFERPNVWRDRNRTVRGDSQAGPAPAAND
jgi:endonuclease YncB( thermonuclease family)